MTLGTNNFKTSTLTRHASSADHQKALIASKEGSNMDASINTVVTKEENGIMIE
jgi:hypothetical protein